MLTVLVVEDDLSIAERCWISWNATDMMSLASPNDRRRRPADQAAST